MGIFGTKKQKNKKDKGPTNPVKKNTNPPSLTEGGIPLSKKPVIHKCGEDKKTPLSKIDIMQKNSIPSDPTAKKDAKQPVVQQGANESKKSIFNQPQEVAIEFPKSEQNAEQKDVPNVIFPVADDKTKPANPVDSSGGQELKNMAQKLKDFFKDEDPPEQKSFEPYAYGYYDQTPLAPYTKVERIPIIEERSIIVLAVENTAEVAKYRNNILRILNKIVTDNKDSFFLILKTGKDEKFSELLSHKDFSEDILSIDPLLNFTKNNIIDSLIDEDDFKDDDEVNLHSALNYVNAKLEEYLPPFKTMSFKGKKYYISGITAVFIGTGAAKDVEKARAELSKMLSVKKVKNVKYFCTKDMYAVNAAVLGFPVIGHIESNFYK